MKRKIIITVGVLVLILGGAVLYWYSWGIGIEHAGGFPRHYIDIFENLDVFRDIQDAYIGIEGQENLYGIPFVILFMALDSPPYHIELQLADETETLRKMIIETVEVVYDDGEKTQERVNVVKEFTAESISRWSNDGKLQRIPVMWLKCKLDSVVEKSKSCTVKMKGYFVNAAEKKIPFDTSTYFEYEPAYWRVGTLSGIDIIGGG